MATKPKTEAQPQVEEIAPAGDAQTAPEELAVATETPAAEESLNPDIAYVHPDGGTIDAYPLNQSGQVIAPAGDAELLASHGFVPFEEKVDG